MGRTDRLLREHLSLTQIGYILFPINFMFESHCLYIIYIVFHNMKLVVISVGYGENMNFDKINDFFRYQFWHCFLMSLGIDFGAPLASNSMFWCDRFLE